MLQTIIIKKKRCQVQKNNFHFIYFFLNTQKATLTPQQAAIIEEYVDHTDLIPETVVEENTVLNSKPWYFSGGKRMPMESKRSRKTNRRLAKLFPEEDHWSDRITNQLMFIPPEYEKFKAEGKMKTILLFNGLGPWNVKQGK